MRFDTKIAVAVRNDLAVWQKLNVTAFLASGIAAGVEDIMGLYAADASLLGIVCERVRARGLPTAIYTEDMFATGNDDDNRAAVVAVPAAQTRYAGIAVYGPRNWVDKVFKGASLHS